MSPAFEFSVHVLDVVPLAIAPHVRIRALFQRKRRRPVGITTPACEQQTRVRHAIAIVTYSEASLTIAAVRHFSTDRCGAARRWVERRWPTTRQARRSAPHMHGQRQHSAARGLILSPNDLLQDQRVQRQMGNGRPEPRIPLPQHLQPRWLRHLRASIFTPPMAITPLRHPPPP